MVDARDGVREAIARSGMKQIAVAERVGLTERQLCDIVKKRRRLEANEMLKICEVTRITPNDLFALAQGSNQPAPASQDQSTRSRVQ